MYNEFRKNLGKNLKAIRLSKKMTQEMLWLESGVSRSHIALIESGKRDIIIGALFKISRALKVNFKEIFSFDNLEKFKFDIEKFYE